MSTDVLRRAIFEREREAGDYPEEVMRYEEVRRQAQAAAAQHDVPAHRRA